jgi:type IV pilus assembly protein PilA
VKKTENQSAQIIGAQFCANSPTLLYPVHQLRPSFSVRTSAFTLVEIMVVVVVIGLLASIAIPAFQKIRSSSQDKAVLNNARQLAGAGDQYMMETGRTSVAFSVLVGPTNYIKDFAPIAGETYPLGITHLQAVTVTGVGSLRTITYAP